jgi:hypothetical protein
VVGIDKAENPRAGLFYAEQHPGKACTVARAAQYEYNGSVKAKELAA